MTTLARDVCEARLDEAFADLAEAERGERIARADYIASGGRVLLARCREEQQYAAGCQRRVAIWERRVAESPLGETGT